MIADTNTIVDGHEYKKGEEIPDLGSLIGYGVSGVGRRSYYGLYGDKDKLPHYSDLQSGSDATLIEPDVGLHYLLYEKTTDTWYNC